MSGKNEIDKFFRGKQVGKMTGKPRFTRLSE